MAQTTAAVRLPMVSHINRALELLWLLTAFLVPLVFVSPGYMEAETVDSFVEVPKVTLLRTLVALMLILWSVKWALSTPRLTWPPDLRSTMNRIRVWLREEPGRWVVVAVLALMAVTILGTLLSAAPRVSLWGEVEAQDSYPAYTMLSYMVLFLVIATHVRTRAQVMRLVWAIAASGLLIGSMAIIQEYELEPFGFMELGEGQRATSTMGNPIFAGAALLLTIPMTLLAALLSIERYRNAWRGALWAIALTVQLLGITFTLSRGPWVGLGMALVVFLALTWHVLGRARLLRAATVLGAALAITVAVVLLSSPANGPEAAPGTASSEAVPQRLTSISSEVVGGGLSNRVVHWKASWRLIRSRPWFEFEDLSFPFLRPLIGYGPDLFRYTYLLESRPQREDRIPLEAHYAHNMLIHQAVELGLLGVAAWLALLGATFAAGVVRLVQWRDPAAIARTWILIALFSVMAGRVLEQTVGLAKAGDLTLFWVLLALFVALPAAMEEAPSAPVAPPRLRNRRRVPQPTAYTPFSLGLLGVAALLVVVGWIAWVQNINYAWAAKEMGDASSAFREGDGPGALENVEQALELAPYMASYYNNKAQVLEAFRLRAQTEEQVASLAEEAYLTNLEGLRRDPLSYRARYALAVSALTLATLKFEGKDLSYRDKDEEALRLFRETTQMVPGAWPLYNLLAAQHIRLGQSEEALRVLDKSISLSGNAPVSAYSWGMKGAAFSSLGQVDNAIDALNRSLELDGTGPQAVLAHQQLANIYSALGQPQLAGEHLAQAQALSSQ